jgi:hypothetical protein
MRQRRHYRQSDFPGYFSVHNGANASTAVFKFAQNVESNNSGAIVRAGSYMEYAVA